MNRERYFFSERIDIRRQMVPRAPQYAQRVLLVLVESVGAVAALQLAVAALHDRLAFQGADDGAEGLVALRMRLKVCTAEDITRNTLSI